MRKGKRRAVQNPPRAQSLRQHLTAGRSPVTDPGPPRAGSSCPGPQQGWEESSPLLPLGKGGLNTQGKVSAGLGGLRQQQGAAAHQPLVELRRTGPHLSAYNPQRTARTGAERTSRSLPRLVPAPFATGMLRIQCGQQLPPRFHNTNASRFL